ncbi:MAG TPA: hypothetical protein VLH40_06260 [Atribacteraceae bacterium]|nr:hypothetical protein [Atribacteraceae bacterium]
MSLSRDLRQRLREYLDLLRVLLEDLSDLLEETPHPYGLVGRIETLFSFPRELPTILAVATEYFPDPPASYPVNPFALMLAIREAEKGRAGREFGVMHPKAKNTDLRTQAAWCAGTIRANFQRFADQTNFTDYIAFLGSRYAPLGAANDPQNLNRHWPGNVRFFYERFNATERR